MLRALPALFLALGCTPPKADAHGDTCIPDGWVSAACPDSLPSDAGTCP